MANPFADLVPQQPQTAPQPITVGTPRIKEPPPVRPVIAERDAVRLERDRRELEQAPFDARKAAADARKAELELRALERKAADPTGALGVEQSTAAGFYRRALNAHQKYGEGVPPRNAFVQGLTNILPEGFVRSQSSPERRAAETYAAEFIAATLRKESGAAISPAEFESQYKRYFPQPGDGPAEFAIKKQLRETALEAIKMASGPAGAAALPLDPEGIGDIGFGSRASGDANSLPEGAQEFRRELLQAIQNGKVRTAEDFIAFGKARGFNADPEEARRAAEAIANGVMPGIATPTFEAPDISDVRNEATDPRIPYLRGIPGAVGLDDELGAVVDTIFGDGTMRENLHRQRAIRDYDEEENFLPRLAGQVTGAALLPTKAPGIALSTTRAGLRGGMGRAEALIAGGKAGAKRLAGEGAAFGGAYGVGSTDGSLLDRMGGGAVNALLGAGAGYGLGRLGGVISSRTNAAGAAERNALLGRGDEAVEAARAAHRLEIDLLPADVGGPNTRRLTSVLTQTPFGGGPIIQGAEKTIQQAGIARDRIAANLGDVLESAASGERALRGGRRWNRASRAEVRSLYRDAENLAGDAQAAPQATMQSLAGLIRAERETPGGTRALSVLEDYAKAFEGGGPMSIAGARKLRTELRSRLRTEGQLSGSDADRLTRQVMKAVGEDIEQALTQSGRQAAIPAFRAADRAHAQRLTTIDEVLSRYVGKDGDAWGSDVAKAIAADSKGNGERLGRFLKLLHPEEANDIRATMISQLGRSRSGSQNAEGAAFSLDEFLTNWDQIRAARGRIFNRETLRGLEDLAKVAARVKQTGRYHNRSQTGGVVAGSLTYAPLVGVLGQAAAGSDFAPTLIAAVGNAFAQYGGGRLLAHPGFARRLANTPQNPRAARRYWSGEWVARMGRGNPSIAGDLAGVQRAIIKAANDNAGRLQSSAASGGNDPRNEQD